MSNDRDREERRGWHIGREVPAAMLIGLIIQTCSFIWWLSGLSSTVAAQAATLMKLEARVETIAAASQLTAINQAKMLTVEAELKELRSSVDRLLTEQARRTGYLEGKGR